MVSNEIWMDSGAMVSMIPEQDIFLGTFASVANASSSTGAIASASNIIKQVIAFARKGVPIIGICNGFQILTESRLLPGTLMINKNLKFICKNVYLKIVNKTSIYSKGFNKNIFNLPIAHKMGVNGLNIKSRLSKLNSIDNIHNE